MMAVCASTAIISSPPLHEGQAPAHRRTRLKEGQTLRTSIRSSPIALCVCSQRPSTAQPSSRPATAGPQPGSYEPQRQTSPAQKEELQDRAMGTRGTEHQLRRLRGNERSEQLRGRAHLTELNSMSSIPQQGKLGYSKEALPYARPPEHPMENPVEGHATHPSVRLEHVTRRLQPLLAEDSLQTIGIDPVQWSASKFRPFGVNGMLACTAVRLCQVLAGTDNASFRAAALWGLGSLVCELADLQNFVAGGDSIMEQIFSDVSDEDPDGSVQSCAAYAIACLVRCNSKLQERTAGDRSLVLSLSAALQGSTRTAVLFSNLQAVGNICFGNVRAQQVFAAEGVLQTVDALCHARDLRIRTTATRCKATFQQALARELDLKTPELRLAVSQQGPFDRSPSQASSSSTLEETLSPTFTCMSPIVDCERVRPFPPPLDKDHPTICSPLRRVRPQSSKGCLVGKTGPSQRGFSWTLSLSVKAETKQALGQSTTISPFSPHSNSRPRTSSLIPQERSMSAGTYQRKVSQSALDSKRGGPPTPRKPVAVLAEVLGMSPPLRQPPRPCHSARAPRIKSQKY